MIGLEYEVRGTIGGRDLDYLIDRGLGAAVGRDGGPTILLFDFSGFKKPPRRKRDARRIAEKGLRKRGLVWSYVGRYRAD